MQATVPPSEWPPTTHVATSGYAAAVLANANVLRKAIPSGCLVITTRTPCSASGRSTAA